jgi:antitoxin HicB
MMRSFSYPATLSPERQSGYTVRFHDLPEAITHGTDKREALKRAADCLEEAIANRIVMRMEIPVPSPARRSQALVPVPAPTAAKAALYLAMKETGVSNTILARRLGCDEKEIRRMLNPRHPTKLPRVHAALQLLGWRLVVAMEDQAA